MSTHEHVHTADCKHTQEFELNNVTVERAADGSATLHIEVAPEAVRASRERVMKDMSRRLRVPGFRPGHVPANIVRRNVGDEAIAQSVSDDIVPLAYQAALKQTELHPLDRASVDQLTFDAFDGSAPLTFKAHVIVRPDMELGELKGLEVTKPPIQISEEDVDRGLDSVRAERATLTNIEGRGAQEGDVITADLQVYIGDQPRSEEPTRLRAFVLGESGFVPRIDEHLIGAALDEERRFNLTYPADFKDPELAGQVAEFVVKVTALKARELPELNDDFAKALGADDVATLRERLRDYIRSQQDRQARDVARQRLVQTVLEQAQFEVPSSLVDSRVARRLQSLEHELEQDESSLETYLADKQQTREEFEAEVRAEIETDSRRDLLLDEIARREELQATPNEIETHYHMLSQSLQIPLDTLVERVDVNNVRASILQSKAIDWLYDNAVVTEMEVHVGPETIVDTSAEA